MSRKLAAIIILVGTLSMAQIGESATEQNLLKICYTTWGKMGGETLPNKGAYSDLAARPLQEAGYQVSVDILPWDRCIESAKLLIYDVVAAGWKGDSFDNDFIYLRNTGIDTINFVVLEDSPIESGDFEALKGKRIVMLQSAGIDRFEKNRDLFQVTTVHHENQMMEMLAAGRVDALLTSPHQSASLVAKEFPALVGRLRTLEPPLVLNYASPMVPVNHPRKLEIKMKFDEAYRHMVKQGLYKKIKDLHGINVPHLPLD